MNRILKISGIFLLGVIVGAVLMNLLYMYVRPVYRHMIRTQIKTDQQFLASRATREGNKIEAAMHRWFVLEMDSEKSRHEKSDRESDSSFLFPFYWAPLRKQADSRAKERPQNYRHIEEGMERAWLAAALEDINEKQEASKQWLKAQTLLGESSVENTRKIIFDLLEKEKTDTYIEGEKMILGDTNQAQQKNRGDRE
jgi:hypothetical protein